VAGSTIAPAVQEYGRSRPVRHGPSNPATVRFAECCQLVEPLDQNLARRGSCCGSPPEDRENYAAPPMRNPKRRNQPRSRQVFRLKKIRELRRERVSARSSVSKVKADTFVNNLDHFERRARPPGRSSPARYKARHVRSLCHQGPSS
jgi:hypothetical protein